MIRILGTVFAILAGLAFGSFLSVCLSRWLAGDNVIRSRSRFSPHDDEAAWWKNLPFINWRIPLVILSVGVIWGLLGWRLMGLLVDPRFGPPSLASLPYLNLEYTAGTMFFCLALVGLASVDARHFVSANLVTLPGVAVGIVFYVYTSERMVSFFVAEANPLREIGQRLIAVLVAAGLILTLRLLYWLVIRREGIGLGDVGLMAMLAAWLGLQGAMLALAMGICLGVLASIVAFLRMYLRRTGGWAIGPLSLGTCLCTGGIVSCLWGPQILASYLR
jgi:leader peptidase (prepilin peptidase)/N-methyltransferase